MGAARVVCLADLWGHPRAAVMVVAMAEYWVASSVYLWAVVWVVALAVGLVAPMAGTRVASRAVQLAEITADC